MTNSQCRHSFTIFTAHVEPALVTTLQLIQLYNHLIGTHLIPMAGLHHKKRGTNELPTLETLNDLAQQPKCKVCGVGANSPAPPPSVPTFPSVCPLCNINYKLANIFQCRFRPSLWRRQKLKTLLAAQNWKKTNNPKYIWYSFVCRHISSADFQQQIKCQSCSSLLY